MPTTKFLNSLDPDDELDAFIRDHATNKQLKMHLFQTNRCLVRVVRPDGSRETLVINDGSRETLVRGVVQ